jgi:hypothetical protein
VSQPVGIDFRRLRGHERPGANETEARREVGSAPFFDLDAGSSPRPRFLLQNRPILLPRCEINARSPGEIAVDAERADFRFQQIDALMAGAVSDFADTFAMPHDQIDEMGVHFVLQERGARAGAAVADVPCIQHHHLVTVRREGFRHQRPGDARSENGDLTARIRTKWRIAGGQAVFHRPERMIGGQVHRQGRST